MKALFAPLLILPFFAVTAQTDVAGPDGNALYQKNCAMCHGGMWEGGKGGTLLRERWKYFTGDETPGVAQLIHKGIPEMGMPSFAGTLTGPEIQTLVAFIESRRQADREMRKRQPSPDENRIHNAAPYSFRLEVVAASPSEMWALAFLPDGRMLYTEKDGALYVLDPEHPGTCLSVQGIPKVRSYGLGGLLDVAVHPDFAKNGWIYLTYTEAHSGGFFGRDTGMIAVVRGRIQEGKWVDQQDLFHLPDKYFSTSGDHLGSRIVIKGGFIFFSIGDRGVSVSAQDLASPNGKIFRLADDGKIPPDNPFPKAEGILAAIWCYGNRNPEGLAFQPGTGVLWESEHGPFGGDEINVIEGGKNYGWPVVSYGIEDHGGPRTSPEPRPGMEQPKYYWAPCIAVCGITFYEGDKFPLWKGSLFASSLRAEELHRLTVKDRSVVGDEVVLRDEGRIRDVVSGPDGTLYLILTSPRNDSSRIVRMVPAIP